MQRAADLSVNTYFVRLAEKVGVMNIANMAQRLGVTSLPMTGPDKVTPKDGTITLGVYDVSPIDMATAYATIAARGERCEPLPIVSVTRADGRPAPQMPQRCTRVLPPEVADTAAQILQGVVDHGTGTNAQLSDRPAAGKTGTTDSNAAVWFDGFTPDYAAVVVAADPRGAAYPLRNVLGISRMHGGDLPAKIWHDTLTVAEQGLPVRDFPIPGPIGLLSDQSTVPNVAGLDVQDAMSALEAAGLTVAPLPANSSGEVVTGTQPAAGAAVQDGQAITLQIQQP
jgi:membrane peptidoglycan carboxypeptidase